MSKIIAVWGASSSGKTTLASKIAYHCANVLHKNTFLLSTGVVIPTLPLLFPLNKEIEGKSIGKAVVKADITQEDILENSVVVSSNLPLLVTGYNLFENSRTYPNFAINKWTDAILQMSQLADYVIVDCSSDATNNMLTAAAFNLADSVIQIYTPEVKSIIFYSSQKSVFENKSYTPDNFIKVMRLDNDNKYQDVENIVQSEKIDHKLPYSNRVNSQFQSGQLFSNIPDRSYQTEFLRLMKEVL